MERIFVVFDAHDREEEFELTQAVNDMMSLVQLLAPDLSPMLIHPMREAAIVRAAEQVARAQRRRGNISSPWFIRRVTSPRGDTASCIV